MRELEKIPFALAFAVSLGLIAASTASAAVTFFVSAGGARPVRAEGLTEAVGTVVFSAQSSGVINVGATLTLGYGAGVVDGTGTVSNSCTFGAGGNFARTYSGSSLTLTVMTAALTCASGQFITVSGVRVNANARGAGSSIGVAVFASGGIFLTVFSELTVATVQASPSITVALPTSVTYEVTERFAQVFLSKSQEQGLSDNGCVQDFAIRFSFVGVPLGVQLTTVTFTGSDPTLTGLAQTGLPFTSLEGAQDVNVDVAIGGTSTTTIEKLVAIFQMTGATVSLRGGTVAPEVPRFVATSQGNGTSRLCRRKGQMISE